MMVDFPRFLLALALLPETARPLLVVTEMVILRREETESLPRYPMATRSPRCDRLTTTFFRPETEGLPLSTLRARLFALSVLPLESVDR